MTNTRLWLPTLCTLGDGGHHHNQRGCSMTTGFLFNWRLRSEGQKTLDDVQVFLQKCFPDIDRTASSISWPFCSTTGTPTCPKPVCSSRWCPACHPRVRVRVHFLTLNDWSNLGQTLYLSSAVHFDTNCQKQRPQLFSVH